MRTVYAIQFDVSPKDNESAADCVACLRGSITSWIQQKYERSWHTKVEIADGNVVLGPLPNHSIAALVEHASDASLMTLEWRHPHEDRDDPSNSGDKLQWFTQILIARKTDSVQVQLLLRILSLDFVLKPVAFNIGRPGVVATLLRGFDCAVGGTPIPTAVREVSAERVEKFVEQELLAAHRRIPLVVLSPSVWSDTLTVDADEVMQSVMGYAAVVSLKDKWAAFKLTDSIGKKLSCYDGAVRTYWPGFSLNADPYRHALYLQQQIRFHTEQGRPLGQHLFRFFTDISVFRLAEGKVIRTVRDAIESVRMAELETVRRNLKQGLLDPKEREQELEKAWDTIKALKKEVTTLRQDKATLDRELSQQKALWTQYGGYIEGEDEEGPPQKEEDRPVYETVAAVVQAAQKDFDCQLLFLKSAIESAAKSPYGNPERVYHCFQALALVAKKWQETGGRLGKGWKAELASLGFGSDYRSEVSQTAKGKWADEYTFVYKGKRLLFEEHITLGAKQADKCLCVHWYRDDERHVLAIGWCGRHRTNTRS